MQSAVVREHRSTDQLQLTTVIQSQPNAKALTKTQPEATVDTANNQQQQQHQRRLMLCMWVCVSLSNIACKKRRRKKTQEENECKAHNGTDNNEFSNGAEDRVTFVRRHIPHTSDLI